MCKTSTMRRGAVVVLFLLVTAVPAQASRTQLVATLHADARLYYGTSLTTPRPTSIAAHRPLTGIRTMLPVLRAARAKDGTRFLRVLVPGRPNGRAAWIVERKLKLSHTAWRIVIRTERRRVYVLHGGRIVKAFSAVVGKPSTPTPYGRFFVEEILTMRTGAPGWPFAFALSARSDVFQEFDGGPGQIAMHGVYGVGGVLGTAESHGCIRLDSTALSWLARRVDAGTPVLIRT
jgi:hypothetical protein